MTSRSFQNLLVDRVPILRSSVSTQQMHSPLIYRLRLLNGANTMPKLDSVAIAKHDAVLSSGLASA